MTSRRSALPICLFSLLFSASACTSSDDPLPESPAGDAPDASVPTPPPPPPPQDLATPAPDLSMVTPPPTRCSGLPMIAPGTSTRTLMSRGKARTYILHVPTKYDPTQPTELVFAFHGLSDKADSFYQGIAIEGEADTRNLIVIAPQGLGIIAGWNAGNCCGEPQLFKIDDVGFTSDMIDATKKELCIDDKRIFAMGFSNGGMFVHRLACELADRIAAIGPVSGTPMVKTCTPSRPISLLHMHGTADKIVGYNGGGTGTFPKVSDVIADWASRDSCTGMPVETYKNGNVTCNTYETCAAMSEVGLCTIEGGEHAWPGAAGATMDIKATPTILDFFAKHPM